MYVATSAAVSTRNKLGVSILDTIDPAEICRQADAFRDKGKWKLAADAYAQFLRHRPEDFDIWVQQGNCLKEFGSYEAALQSYRTAFQLNPDDADLHLQLGHLHKLTGDLSIANDHYKRSMRLDASSPAFAELAGLDEPSTDKFEGDSIAGLTNYLDVTDVLLFLEHHTNVTGIQRVIVNVFERIHLGLAGHTDRSIIYCFIEHQTGRVRQIPPGMLYRVFSLLKERSVDRAILSKALAVCRTGKEAEPVAGDVYMILGAFWVSPSYPELLMSLRDAGVSIGLYIYDLIPINNKEYVPAPNARDFALSGINIMQLCDFALTISEFVAGEVREFIKTHMGRTIPVKAVPLAQDFVKPVKGAAIGDEVREVVESDFVLSVGTIEIRKNHIYLIRIWQDLIAKRGADNVPNLVFVGRWGWRVEEMKELLDATHYLNGKVIVLDHVADSELSLLYEKCLFTAFPSFVEGWGLPIGESLVYGKLCICSGTTSMPEVGGNFVRYIDPFNINEGKQVIAWAIENPNEVAALSEKIRREFVRKTWSNVADDLIASIEEIGLKSDGRDAYATLARGVVNELSSSAIDKLAESNPAAFILKLSLLSGWNEMEDWGVWASGRNSRFRFQVEGGEDGAVYRLGINLRLPMPDGQGNLRIQSNGITSTLTIRSGKDRWYFTTIRARSDGVVDLKLNYAGPHMTDHRKLYVGVSGVAIALNDSPLERAEMVEGIITYQ